MHPELIGLLKPPVIILLRKTELGGGRVEGSVAEGLAGGGFGCDGRGEIVSRGGP